MRNITFTLEVRLPDEEFNSKDFQETIADFIDTESLKKDFNEEYPDGELIETKIIVK